MGLQIQQRVHLRLHQVKTINNTRKFTAQTMKFSIKDFFRKCKQILRFLRIWSHLRMKSLMETFISLCSDSEMLSNLTEALEVYRAAWLILTKTEYSIEETDAQETGLGLTGPGNGRLTIY